MINDFRFGLASLWWILNITTWRHFDYNSYCKVDPSLLKFSKFDNRRLKFNFQLKLKLSSTSQILPFCRSIWLDENSDVNKSGKKRQNVVLGFVSSYLLCPTIHFDMEYSSASNLFRQSKTPQVRNTWMQGGQVSQFPGNDGLTRLIEL